MANPEYVAILKQGTAAWKKWCADHPGASLDIDLEGADLRGVNLAHLHLSHARLRGADLSGAVLVHARISVSDLSEAKLQGAFLHSANLELTNLSRSDLSRADVRHARLRDANLEEAVLVRATLEDSELWRTNLRRANLERASLRLVQADEALFDEACLRQADLFRARLDHSSLEGADLTHTLLEEVDFTEARLVGADFSHARLRRTLLNQVDLRTVKGLETVEHRGPSFVDPVTLHLADGTLPGSFLQGVGLPDPAIAYAQSAASADLHRACFLCFLPNEQDFAERLFRDLQARGVRCWLANMRQDEPFARQTDNPAQVSDTFLFIIPHKVLHGGGVAQMTLKNVLQWEHQAQRQLVIPLCVEAEEKERMFHWWATMCQRSWSFLRKLKRVSQEQPPFPDRVIFDFSRWQEEEAYQERLHQLVAFLQ